MRHRRRGPGPAILPTALPTTSLNAGPLHVGYGGTAAAVLDDGKHRRVCGCQNARYQTALTSQRYAETRPASDPTGVPNPARGTISLSASKPRSRRSSDSSRQCPDVARSTSRVRRPSSRPRSLLSDRRSAAVRSREGRTLPPPAVRRACRCTRTCRLSKARQTVIAFLCTHRLVHRESGGTSRHHVQGDDVMPRSGVPTIGVRHRRGGRAESVRHRTLGPQCCIAQTSLCGSITISTVPWVPSWEGRRWQ